MDTEAVARTLEELGILLEIRGENPFRCRAYHTAAQALRGLTEDLTDLIASGRLEQIPGIGASMRDKITRLATTGRLEEYEALRRETPSGLIALVRVPGLGPKKVRALHEALGIRSLEDLKAALRAGKVAAIKGFGEKTAARIAEGISFLESSSERIRLDTATRLALPLLERLRTTPGVAQADWGGSLRRRAETIGDLDLLFAADDPAPVLAACAGWPEVESVLAQGSTRLSVRLSEGPQLDVRGVLPSQYAFALNYFTGSKAHNIHLRRRAQERGLKLSEYALEGPRGAIACRDEAALYRALGLSYIPPELREDQGEIEAAESGSLPKLLEYAHLKGTFHCHTDWSDGLDSLEAMVEAARSLGLEYLGIADHSRSAAYAGGLSIERVREQRSAIDRLNQSLGPAIRVFQGIECDILADGSLDYPDEVLAGFDYVVASVHSNFRLSRQDMTARICRAAAHPRVTMLGHPTGRLILARAGYEVDLNEVIAVCARHGTMIEINADPHRLDLDALHARAARQAGVTIVINPDAHATAGLANLQFGVDVARRAWLTSADVFNTRPARQVAAALAAGKASSRP
ncbi:MAG: DNA polymerase/3'-5' exonuclease PolX [Isosphaeraceae bacterium]|jgi:DNA polymerase (family 10)|nr:MAG: DNA polymerase/3'-5' exonuclease PolX [Isosphaeraceae bacterium]